MTDWTRASAAELTDAYRRGETTVREVVEQYARRIRQDRLNAFISNQIDAALRRARDLDARRRSGRLLGPMAGIPVAVKDNITTDFAPTTCASSMLRDFHAPFNATVVERLLAADAVIVGKTNMDEFGMGSSTENSAFGPVLNPHHAGYTAGGSSGGSAAAVADRLTCLALGSDTGGSVRQPAALSGCVGFKPSYGTVSRFGLVAFASSFDQVGPMARSVEDVALLYDVIAGHDPRDATSSPRPIPCAREAVRHPPERLRIGLFTVPQHHDVSPDIQATVPRLAALLRGVGVMVEEVSLPALSLGVAAYYIVANAEASANLARFDGVRYGLRARGPQNLLDLYRQSRNRGFGPEVKRRIMLGTWVLSAGYYEAYYERALRVRRRMRQEFARAFESFDVLLSLTTPRTAFRLGEMAGTPLDMYLTDAFTVPANLAGLPAVSLPVGKTDAGLPFGVQLWGARFCDAQLLGAAARLESLVGYDPHTN